MVAVAVAAANDVRLHAVAEDVEPHKDGPSTGSPRLNKPAVMKPKGLNQVWLIF